MKSFLGHRPALLAGAAIFAVAPAPARAPLPEAPALDSKALADALHDLCGKDVALLGEATHGDGRTLAFKAALVPRLVEKCGFDAIFFEASQYDFLALDRKRRNGEPVTRAQLASAIGGLWSLDQEMQPLIDYMFTAAAAGHLRLGGIDDNLGSAGAFYSLDEMPAELSSRLADPRAAACRTTLKRRIYYNYGAAPYSEAERVAILRCLDEIGAALRGAGDRVDRPVRVEQTQMLASFRRFVERDFRSDPAQIRDRDRSMYLNFRWLAARLPPHSKVIVWGATSHIARDGAASGRYPQGGNLGAYISGAYGKRAFALGFSARGGVYRLGPRSGTRALPAPPAGSLEARALPPDRDGAVYLGPRSLARLGSVPAAPFAHEYQTAPWNRILDGLVLFPEERSPRLVPAP
ncbi:MAG: erythromycin esterase family protein [Allosphingosinicella sp.]